MTTLRWIGVVASVLGMFTVARADFISVRVRWTPRSNAGVNYLRWTISAQFSGPTDTVLWVSNLSLPAGGSGAPAHADTLALAQAGAVPTNLAGTWNPRAVLADAGLAGLDSYVTIGGVASPTNTTQADPQWTSGGNADARGWDRPDLPSNGLIGWFNANPQNLQGRVGNSPGLESYEVRLLEVTYACSTAMPFQSFTIAYNSGQPGSAIRFATAALPLGGVPPPWYRDLDGDGYGASASGMVNTICPGPGFVASNDDCDDADPSRNPGTAWYRDVDGDGFGFAPDGLLRQCAAPIGYVANSSDNCPSIADPTQADCNANGIGDVCEIDGNARLDLNANGALDSCELKRGDLDLDGVVNAADLTLLLAYWGVRDAPVGDLSGDGMVGGADLTIMLGNWGTTP